MKTIKWFITHSQYAILIGKKSSKTKTARTSAPTQCEENTKILKFSVVGRAFNCSASLMVFEVSVSVVVDDKKVHRVVLFKKWLDLERRKANKCYWRKEQQKKLASNHQ
jgi:hypothetical protein